MTIYVGVDIAKSTHYAAMTNQHGEILIEPFAFSNDKSGFDLFLETVKPFVSQNDELIVGFESTAHYASNFSHFLDTHSISYIVINPLVTSSFRKTKIRKTKTDSVDSILICNVLSLNISDKQTMIREVDLSDLYSLCVSKHNLIKMRTKSKIQLVSYIDRFFPELEGFFNKNVHINTVYQLIKKYPTPDDIKKVRIDKLTNFLDEASHGMFKKDKAVKGTQKITFKDKKDAEDACELYKEYKSDDKTTVKCSGKSLTIVTTDEDMLPDEDYTKEKVKEELEDQGFKCK